MPFHTIPAILPDSVPNQQVTHTGPVGGAGECAIAVNPNNPKQMIMGVRQVPSLTGFVQSIVAAYYSADAGLTWSPSSTLSLSPPPPNAQWGGATDPAPAWDSLGNAYMLTLPVSADFQTPVGIAAYKSTDGGATWGPPSLVDINDRDDKPSVAIDTSGGAFDGRIYAIWNREGASVNEVSFARSKDHGASWIGLGTGAAGDVIATTRPWASIAVSPDGRLYVAFRHIIGTAPGGLLRYGIGLLRSDDGGESFHNCSDVQDIIALHQPFEAVRIGADTLEVSHFQEATFKVDFYVAICAGNNGAVFCAWPDQRNPSGYPAIYYARSEDFGQTWKGSNSGLALTGVATPAYDFQPQLATTPNGVVACAFYRFRPTTGSSGVIDVWLRTSFDNGKTFPDALRLNDRPWDPSKNATIIGTGDGGTKFTFIGDYFALAAGVIGPTVIPVGLTGEGFVAAWTDTRTGGPEIFSNRGFVGQSLVYNPIPFPPPTYINPGDPAQLRFEVTAVLTATSFVIVGLQIGLLSLTSVPRLLPESIGLSFAAGFLFRANLVRLRRESTGGLNDQTETLEVLSRDKILSRSLGTTGILTILVGLALLILPLHGLAHDAALVPTFYSTVIGVAVAAICYIMLRGRRN